MANTTEKWYFDEDGNIHWPDTFVGSKLDYAIDWQTLYLSNENDNFVSMTWNTLPTGLTSAFKSDANGLSIIQLETLAVGDYKIEGTMLHEEAGHQQELAIRIFLKVI